MAALLAFSGQIAFAQSLSSSASLDAALYRSVCERIDGPMVFSTRDTLFALSLPVDEPAEVYVQITVGRNGKVKEKLTRVNANHLAGYVAPAFISATKDLQVDRSLVGNLTGKDTSLVLAFPLEYQCVYDTVSKEQPDAGAELRKELYRHYVHYEGGAYTNTQMKRELDMQRSTRSGLYLADYKYEKAEPTPVWYYFACITDKSE